MNDPVDAATRARAVAAAQGHAPFDVLLADGTVVDVGCGVLKPADVGRIPGIPQAALLSGWGEWTGAVATTVAHDTHNLVVFGRDPADMAAAANRVIADGGGVAVARSGAVIASVALPIAGILSPLPAGEVAAAQRRVQDAAVEVGLFSPVLTQPLFQVMVSSLACLPGPHLTDLGIIDGTTGELLDSMLV